MIHCRWCGAQNYAIDSWCSSCSRHLDWAPPPPTTMIAPPPPPDAPVAPPPARRAARPRRLTLLAAAAAGLGVAIALALPVANWFSAAGQTPPPAQPSTALRPAVPSSPSATSSPPATSSPSAQPSAPPAPTAEASPSDGTQPGEALVPTGGDPLAAVTRFYQDVSAHDFAAAAALWTSRMQARYPPAEYIDHRFAATQEITLQAERTLSNSGGVATVYVDIVEVIDGQTRNWVGTWQLVDTASGWLLDRPNLQGRP
jgi:hypothetical protein